MKFDTYGEYKDWASNPDNWPKGPLVGKRVRILAGSRHGEVHEVVADMHPRFPMIGILFPGADGPAGYFVGEYEEVKR